MPRVKKLDLGMTALDELFMNDKERAENKLPKIFDIPLSEIDDFPDHPYRVLDDEDKEPVCGYIVFSPDSFDKPYSEQSRTYVVSSNNKAFISGAGGYSIYGSCLDGTDQYVRLEGYMRGENAWKIDRCYMKRDDYERAVSQQVKNKDNREER